MTQLTQNHIYIYLRKDMHGTRLKKFDKLIVLRPTCVNLSQIKIFIPNDNLICLFTFNLLFILL